MPKISYDDEVTEELARGIDEILHEEFDRGEWAPLSNNCSECSRQYVHDNAFDWAYWERYEDGSFICPRCRGVDVRAERRKLLGRND